MRDQPQDLRGLKALVGGMGVLIILGTTIVVGTVIHRLYASYSAPPPTALAPLAVPMVPVAAGAASLQPGEHVAGMAAAGADLAIWVSGPGGDRVLLLDPASGQIRVALQAAGDDKK